MKEVRIDSVQSAHESHGVLELQTISVVVAVLSQKVISDNNRDFDVIFRVQCDKFKWIIFHTVTGKGYSE